MYTQSINKIHELVMNFNKISFNRKEVELRIKNLYQDDKVDKNRFVELLVESGSILHLAYFKNWMNKEELRFQLEDFDYPIILLSGSDKDFNPVILYKEGNKINIWSWEESDFSKKELSTDDLKSLLETVSFQNIHQTDKETLVLTCFPNKPVFSDEDESETENIIHKFKTFNRFLSLLKSEKREISYLYIYAVISGIIGLSLPLGIQSIIGFVSSGQVFTSVVVLIIFIILGIIITGALQVMQLSLVEHIQQWLFTKTAFEFAYRIPKLKIESVLKYYPPELMNRFFDIITLQKGLAKILLEFSAALLQIILGLILLSLYHSSFIFLGIFLVIILTLIIRYTGPKGLKTSLKESKYKYMLANWLEEMAKSLRTFKNAGYSNLPLEKTDYYVSNYLYARKSHFKVLVSQYVSFVAFKTFITGGLLILGCILLINKQINIGQFVASEIIIILIMTAVEKIIIHLDTVYDILTSIEKIGNVTDLPIETSKGINIQKTVKQNGISLKVKELKYKYPNQPHYTIKGIDLEINSSERVCLSGYSSSGKTTFINILLGFLSSYEGVVAFNNISLRNINKNSLFSLTGDNIAQEDLFDGTLIENISLGRGNISLDDILWAIDLVGLNEFVQTQKDGIYTKLTNGKTGISESLARRIILAKSIVIRPKLLILEDFLMGMERDAKMKLIDLLLNKEFGWTLIIISNDPDVMQKCDRTIIMKEGKLIANGSFESIKQDKRFTDIL